MFLIVYCKANNIPRNEVHSSQNLEKTLLQINNSRVTTNSYDEVDATSTVCPEDLKQLETSTEILNTNLVHKDEEGDNKKQVDSQQRTTICPEEIRKTLEQELQTLHKTLNLKTTNTISQESEVRFENGMEMNQEDEGLDIKQTSQRSEDTTTPCPEDLLKQTQNISNSNTNVTYSEEITTVSSGQMSQEEDRFQNQVETNSGHAILKKQSLSEAVIDVTTICPEELIKKQEEKRKENEAFVKSLLKVQKDSVLLKLINKNQESSVVKEESQNTNGGNARSKRQISDFSPPYVGQPGYNSQGLALTSADQYNQNYNIKSPQSAGSASYQNNQQTSYTSRVSNNQPNYSKRVPATYNIQTYQQIQRQYQHLYPKTYQNYAKPVKSYLNPSSNVRYPSNSNFKNYYKLKSGINRRQFQASARPKSTTIRSIKTTIKKKFRPSPVFA